jgi:hypothetical protein
MQRVLSFTNLSLHLCCLPFCYSNMVHLKYGQDRAMNHELIQEAGTALGRWMASNREAGKTKTSSKVIYTFEFNKQSSA